jgi:hypothetical protein
VLDNLHEAIETAGGGLRFGQRQLLYVLRPIVREEIGENLLVGNFNTIITDYEAEHGEIEGMYREPRGSILRNPTESGQGIRRKADSNPMIADSG